MLVNKQWGTTEEVPANNKGEITFTYPIACTSWANPILSSTHGYIYTSGSPDEGCYISLADTKSCIIHSEWNGAIKQTYRVVIIGK